MRTRAVRLYGANDLRLEEFELPPLREDEILVRIVSDSICMSTHKLLIQGKQHKRCPQDVDRHPVIIGHEFAGDIVEVGARWRDQFAAGQRFAQQPALNWQGRLDSPGYSYQFFGGSCTYCVIPPEVMELGCLLPYDGDSYFSASLGEPISCVIGGYRACYHTDSHSPGHVMGVKPGGAVLILGGAGPMGQAAVEYALAAVERPGLVVVTDVDPARLARASRLTPPELAGGRGVDLRFVNPDDFDQAEAGLRGLTDGRGYDDVFVFAPIRPLVELGDRLLAFDGCLNFFAGPAQADFKAEINLYNTHYGSTHLIGTTGGSTDDLKEGLALAAAGQIRPAVMVSHIGGIDAIIPTVTELPRLPGGKKLTYPGVELPLTAIDDFAELGRSDPLFAQLAAACDRHQGLWNAEAETILLAARGGRP
ncbi:MAG: zinc-binding dehydrogenase [Propionibacteriaceae bacterium]|jgi:threonine dehydrogenase-like Zn-dependent dehydrogenase|nr:zinc-binding dehydrogenase [Propionibacteriaceae bacterium]